MEFRGVMKEFMQYFSAATLARARSNIQNYSSREDKQEARSAAGIVEADSERTRARAKAREKERKGKEEKEKEGRGEGEADRMREGENTGSCGLIFRWTVRWGTGEFR